jgi:hypothetical protein
MPPLIKPPPPPTFAIEEAPPALAALFREWAWWDRAWWVDYRLQVALWGRRRVFWLCDDCVFWLGKEGDVRDVIRTMARWSNLERS